jgi:GH43 family beta-xylosidase
MRTIKIPASAKEVNSLLEQARQENLILKSADGYEFVLAEIDDFDREIELTRQNKQLMELLDRRARQAATVSLDQAKTVLGLGEKDRR